MNDSKGAQRSGFNLLPAPITSCGVEGCEWSGSHLDLMAHTNWHNARRVAREQQPMPGRESNSDSVITATPRYWRHDPCGECDDPTCVEGDGVDVTDEYVAQLATNHQLAIALGELTAARVEIARLEALLNESKGKGRDGNLE